MKLWVDDVRLPPGEGWAWARTSGEAIECLKRQEYTEMSLDHDLGNGDTSQLVVLWLRQNNDCWPRRSRVHSAHSAGRSHLFALIYKYSPYQSRVR